MKPANYYIQKVDEALETAETPPNNVFYAVEHAAAWAQIALLALALGPQEPDGN